MLSLYRPLTDLFRDDFIEREFGALLRPAPSDRREGFHPAVAVVDAEDAYLIKAELPGVSPEQIELKVENGVLTLTGERQHESTGEEAGYRRVERRYGRFSRSFTLPEGTPAESIEAHADNGVLTVTVPKPARQSSRQVEIKTGPAREIPAQTARNVA
jgi:HSP20 family protein